MLKSWLTLAALAVAVAALGAWLYYKPARHEAQTEALSALKAGDAKRARVERAPNIAVVLERRDGTWLLTEPFRARADAFQVARLLTILDARSAVRYPATDLTRYGLDHPMAKVTIEDQVFTFGAFNKTTGEQYVQSGDSVYLIPLGPSASLPRDAQALIARSLLGPDETPVKIELPDFTVMLENGAWQVNPPNEAGADEKAAWVSAWQVASALRAERYDGALPGPFIRVTLKSGTALTFGIVQRDPDLVLVRVDEGIAYHFVASTARRMLAPPGTKAAKPPA